MERTKITFEGIIADARLEELENARSLVRNFVPDTSACCGPISDREKGLMNLVIHQIVQKLDEELSILDDEN